MVAVALWATWPTPLPAAEGRATVERVRQGVVDELLRDGTSLAKLGRELCLVSLAGREWRLTVLDSASGRVVAERSVTAVPRRTEAAIAQLVLVARPMVVVPPPAGLAEGSPDRKKAEQEYEARAVGFVDVVRVTTTREVVVTSAIEPYRGTGRAPLEGEAFYAYVGRRDLADRYVRSSAVRAGAIVVGTLVAAGGLGYASMNLRAAFDSGASPGRTTRMELGIGAVVIGVVGAGIASFTSPRPVSDQEARRLGDEYNARLRHELGLEGEPGPAPETPEPRPEEASTPLSVAPWVFGHGGGLALRIGF